MVISAIDHLVILVGNLAAAVADYEALGFTITPGGEHTDGATHNALISFADGS
ncbi:MAG: VOC family protein, partial [Chloroflexales bacterium]